MFILSNIKKNMSESKVFKLEDVQKNFMNDIKNQLDIKDKDVLHITFKKKKCNCPSCNHCFDYIHISDRVFKNQL